MVGAYKPPPKKKKGIIMLEQTKKKKKIQKIEKEKIIETKKENKYFSLGNLKCNGKRYSLGDEIEISDQKLLDSLVDKNVIELR